jgi:maleate isomerase
MSTHRTRRIGMIIPSSNTVVECTVPKLLPADGSVSAHFARFRVVEISGDENSIRQFATDALVAAAQLLADAKVDLILWNGTAASWLGFDYDASLVAAIEGATGLPAITAVQAINGRLQRLGVRRIGLVTPYVETLESRILENYGTLGIEVCAKARLDLTDNTAYAEVSTAALGEMVRTVAKSSPDAILILCTNLAGAEVAGSFQKELGLPVLDSVAVAVESVLQRLMKP